MKIIGIDPGLAITGVAIVTEEKNKHTLQYSSAITTPAKANLPNRLTSIYNDLLKILKKHNPDVAVLENLFFNTNAKTAFLVGQARGVVQLALSQNGIQIVEYTPLQVKMALTGYGRSEKHQIQKMVSQVLHLSKILTPDDVADAAAIALTHCFSYKMAANLKSKFPVVK